MREQPWLSFARASFLHQLATVFSVGILCLALLSSIAISTLSSRVVHRKLVEQGLKATETLAGQSTLALLYLSTDNAEEPLGAALAFPDVQGAGIFDAAHKALLSRGEDTVPGEAQSVWPIEPQLALESPEAWYFVAPVFVNRTPGDGFSPFETHPKAAELIGFVRVKMSKETLKTMARSILRTNLAVSIGFALVLLLLLLATTRRLTTPLKNLANIMRQASSGAKNLRADVRGPKDIIDMEKAFNTMMEVLENRELQLENTRDAALESARIKGEFAANVSHELRTPLNGVLGMLELLQDMGLSPKQDEYVAVARSAGESLLRLIDDILDFSRTESGALTFQPIDFELAEVLEETLGLVASQAQRKALDMGYLIADEVPPVLRGDPVRIRQVLVNLAGNAIKFTEHGAIEIKAQVGGDEAFEGTACLRFEVVDSGIGIPSEAQRRIFEAFTQADGSTTRTYGGAGLGLTICRKLVDFMGGDIGVFSQPGRGSRFWFTVPLVPATEIPARRREEPGSLAELRLLIVDDSPVNRRFLEHLAKDWGTDHASAVNGYKALQMIRLAVDEGRPYHIALVDEFMPGLGGIELARLLEQELPLAHPGIVLLSHRTRPLEIPDRPANIFSCVTKPVRPRSLYDCLAKARPVPRALPAALPPADEAGPCTGKRILIVEDNRASQQVAVGMLERLGCDTMLAATGQEALDLLRHKAFDLILMDCHMPQMDGYEASRRIRALEGKQGHIPIVAMTANVQEGESDLCIAAGMDDYLAKPLKLDLLKDKLGRWLAGGRDRFEPAPASTDLPRQDEVSSLPTLDHNVLGKLREETGEAFGRIVEVFLEDTPVYFQSLAKATEVGDREAVTELAHCLKGSGRNLGAQRLVEIAKRLETLDPTEFHARAGSLFARLASEFELFKAELEHELMPAAESRAAENPHLPCILVVDDDRTIRFALLNVLQKDGYRIEQATNGAQALALCERKLPDLVLMDARMPRMDGFTACSKIRELPGGAEIPVLIITALDDEHSIERAFSHGATDYIPKPVHFAVLRQRVARMLDASRAQQHVTRLAHEDVLTGLPNRTQFRERLETAIGRACLNPNVCHAVLFLDLDRFKLANDTMGHEVGDLLLKTAATRIQECLRDQDIVSRFGGDEFTILLEEAGTPETAAGIAEAICKAMTKPFSFVGRDVYLSTSIGIAMYPGDGTDSGTLIKHADMAMFRAKERGNSYRFFEDGMASAIARKLRLESDLRRGLEQGEFLMHYQPQFDLKSGEMTGMEALIRWLHPDFGVVPPSQFIPLAEESGFIEDLGEWALATACAQNQAWQASGYPKITVAVNLSARQLDVDFETNVIRKVLAETGLEPRYLELELTETTVMKDPAKTRETLRRLKEAGISISIDDFGTGYSSLNHLKHFSFDKLKIDQSFIRDVHSNSDDAGIVLTIIAMARTLKLRVIAEGVETVEQLNYLKRNRCDEGQGYYFSKPLPPAEFEERLLRQAAIPTCDDGVSGTSG